MAKLAAKGRAERAGRSGTAEKGSRGKNGSQLTRATGQVGLASLKGGCRSEADVHASYDMAGFIHTLNVLLCGGPALTVDSA